MNIFRVRRTVMATLMVSTIASLLAAPAVAQCNLEVPPCPGAAPCAFTCSIPLGGCSSGTPLQHGTLSACSGGSFNLIGTRYETTCSTGGGGCTILPPPLGFWGYDMYETANHGCGFPGRPGAESIMNTAVDFGLGIAGHWHFKSANWQSCSAEGCPNGAPTVVALSDVRESLEGTPDHDAWYIAASVDLFRGAYDLDRLTGATAVGGCGEASIPELRVPGVTIAGAACPDSSTALPAADNPIDPAFVDVEVNLETTQPDYFTEGGHNDPARRLIAGMQITYSVLPSAPTTSIGSAWLPARNPANPANDIAGVVPWGAPPAVTVSVPKTTDPVWVAARIVYQDATVNPTGPVPIGTGPRVMTPVGTSCGPIGADSKLLPCDLNAVDLPGPPTTAIFTAAYASPCLRLDPLSTGGRVAVAASSVAPGATFDSPSGGLDLTLYQLDCVCADEISIVKDRVGGTLVLGI